MNFSTASKVLQTIRAGDTVELIRSQNRSKVLNAANCVPPLDEATAKSCGIEININFGEMLTILSRARGQLLSAFLGNRDFFTVKIPIAPVDYRSDWEAKITAEINRPLRESLEYFELHRSIWSSVVTHGVGPRTWRHSDRWLPRFVSMNDLRIPTDTTLDFHNLCWYAHRVSYTPIELVNEVFNKRKNNHWDKKAVATILKGYKEINFTDAANNYDWNTDAEKLAELMKQNGGFYGSDAVPTIPLFHFYFEDEDEEGNKAWYMRVVPDGTSVRGSDGTSDNFLWQSDKPIASSWKELIHCQYGDLSTDAPFKFHSVRGLGFILLDPTFFSNLLKCRLLQAGNDTLNTWLRVNDSSEKSRKQVQEFGNLKVLQQGVSVVPNTERHQPDIALIESLQAQMKQLQGEASSSYTQDTDTGTAREQTAYETRVKMEQVNAMMGGILMTAFKYESYADMEVCRRFLLKNSTDPDVRKFQKKMKAAGIPDQYLDIDLWEVEPVTPIGQGNPTIAQSMIQQMMSIYDKLSPESQNKVLHDYVLVITKDPARANDLVPLETKLPSEAAREASGLFGSLMTGVPVLPWGTMLIDQIDTLMGMLGGKVHMIEQRDNMATLDEAAGLQNAANYINQAIQQLAQDPQQKMRVKQYTDGMAQLGNQIKGVIQRGQQAREAQAKQQQDAAGAADMAKAQSDIQSNQALTNSKLQSSQATTAQKMQHKQEEERRKQQAFDQDQARQNAQALSQLQRDQLMTDADIENKRKVAEASAAAKPTTTEK